MDDNKSGKESGNPKYRCSGVDAGCNKRKLSPDEYVTLGWEKGIKTTWFSEYDPISQTSRPIQLPENFNDLKIYCVKEEVGTEGIKEKISPCCEKTGVYVTLRGMRLSHVLKIYGTDKFSGRSVL